MGILVSIISYSKLLGNYNFFVVDIVDKLIISYSKLLGNYNRDSLILFFVVLYHILNC